jgi:hypothetical protein
MTWSAQDRRQHRSGISVAEVSVVAIRALAASLSEATRCPKRLDGYLAVLPAGFDHPGKR